jgi:hypothetical protein
MLDEIAEQLEHLRLEVDLASAARQTEGLEVEDDVPRSRSAISSLIRR